MKLVTMFVGVRKVMNAKPVGRCWGHNFEERNSFLQQPISYRTSRGMSLWKQTKQICLDKRKHHLEPSSSQDTRGWKFYDSVIHEALICGTCYIRHQKYTVLAIWYISPAPKTIVQQLHPSKAFVLEGLLGGRIVLLRREFQNTSWFWNVRCKNYAKVYLPDVLEHVLIPISHIKYDFCSAGEISIESSNNPCCQCSIWKCCGWNQGDLFARCLALLARYGLLEKAISRTR